MKNHHFSTAVTICTYNRDLLIKDLLNDLVKQTVLPNQIIIVEDISTNQGLDLSYLNQLW